MAPKEAVNEEVFTTEELSQLTQSEKRFQQAVSFTFRQDIEGGYTVDNGGPTNFGVTQSTLDSYTKSNKLPPLDVKKIPQGLAFKIAKEEYFDKAKLGQLPDGLAVAMFDYGFNSGTGTAVKALQKQLGVKQDGIMGPQTLDAVYEYSTKNGEEDLIKKVITDREELMKSLIKDDPKQFKKNENGWKNRIQKLKDTLNISSLNPFAVTEAHAAEAPSQEDTFTTEELFGNTKPEEDTFTTEELFGDNRKQEIFTTDELANLKEDKASLIDNYIRGLKTSVEQIPAMAQGAVGLVADSVDKLFGGDEDSVAKKVRDWGIRGYNASIEKTKNTAKENDDVVVAWNKAKDGDINAMFDFLSYGYGYGTGMFLDSAAKAAIGAAVGTATLSPGIGTVTGAVAGVASKGFLRKAISNIVKKEADDLIFKSAGKISSFEAQKMSVRGLAANIGGTLAATANSMTIEGGSIYGEAVANKGELNGADLARVWASAVAAGGMDAASSILGLGAITGRIKIPGAGGRLSRAAVGGTVGAVAEAGTEGVQTGIERFGAQKSVFDEEGKREMINAAAMGALPGGAVGGIAGGLQGGKKSPVIADAEKAGRVIGIDAQTKLPIIDTTQKPEVKAEEAVVEEKKLTGQFTENELKDIKELSDWEFAQADGGRWSFINDEGQTQFSGNPSGHSETMQEIGPKKSFAILNKALSGEKLTPSEVDKARLLIGDFRSNIKPYIDNITRGIEDVKTELSESEAAEVIGAFETEEKIDVDWEEEGGSVRGVEGSEQTEVSQIKDSNDVYSDIKSKLIAQGYEEDEADANALLWKNRAERAAKQQGISVAQWYGKTKHTLESSEEAPSADALTQSAEGSKIGDYIGYQEPGGRYMSGRITNIVGNQATVYNAKERKSYKLLLSLSHKIGDGGKLFQSQPQADTFYSQVEKVIDEKMPNAATPEMIRGILSEKNGIKAEEYKWMGVDDFLAGKQKVTKKELQDFVAQNQVQVEKDENNYSYSDKTKHSVIRAYERGMPSTEISEQSGIGETTILRWIKAEGKSRTSQETKGVTEDIKKQISDLYSQGNSVSSVAERLGVGTSTVHRELTKKGISRSLEDVNSYEPDIRNKAKELYMSGQNTYEVSDALGLGQNTVAKWMNKEGVSRGASGAQALRVALGRNTNYGIRTNYDRVRAESSYELARIAQLKSMSDIKDITRATDRISYNDGKNNYVPDLIVNTKDGRTIVEEIKPLNKILDEKVLKKAQAAKEFYADKGIEYRLISESDIGYSGFDESIIDKTDMVDADKERARKSFKSAKYYLSKLYDITPSMKKSVMEGQPLFQGGKEPRGWVELSPGEQKRVILTAIRDASTFIHESAHIWLQDMFDFYSKNPSTKEWQSLKSWLNISDEQKVLTRDQHEKFARGFEAYLREGRAPSLDLKAVFEKFKNWLEQIYKSMIELDVELSDDVRGVMDRMFAEESENITPSGQIRPELRAPIKTELFQEKGELFEDLESRSPRTPKGTQASGGVSGAIDSFEPAGNTEAKQAAFKLSERVVALVKEFAGRFGEDYNPSGTEGVFYSGTENIFVKAKNDVAVAVHEVTHYLDKKIGFTPKVTVVKGYAKDGKPIYDPSTKSIRKELTDIYIRYYPGGKKDHALKKRVQEGVAVFFERMVTNPQKTMKEYPGIYKDFMQQSGRYFDSNMPVFVSKGRKIVEDYQRLSDLDKIAARVVDAPVLPSEPFLNAKEAAIYYHIDDKYPLEKLAKEAGVHFKADDPSLIARIYDHVPMIIQHNISDAPFLGIGKFSFGKETYLTMVGNGEIKVKYDYNWHALVNTVGKSIDDFNAWLVARRVVANYKKLDELKIEAERAAQALKDDAAAKARAAQEGDFDPEELQGGLTPQEIRELKNKIREYKEQQTLVRNDAFDRGVAQRAYDQHKDRFKESAQMFDNLVKADAELLNAAGIISDKKLREFVNEEGYATFKRQIENEIIGSGSDLKSKTVKVGRNKVSSLFKYGGSGKDIISPVYSSMENHQEIFKKSTRQMVYNSVGKIADKFPDLFQKVPLKSFQEEDGKIVYPQDKDPNIMMAFEDGKRVPYLVNKDLKSMLDNMLTPANVHIVEKIFVSFSQNFTKGTTGFYFPFAATNFVIDQLSAAANSWTKFIPIYTPVSNLVKVLSERNSVDAKYAMEYFMLGGERQAYLSFADLNPKEAYDFMKSEKSAIERALDILNTTGDVLSIPVKSTELMTRMSEFVRARKAGHSQLAALELAGRVSTPFHHRGKRDFYRGLARSIPYFNASMQVLAQEARSLRSPVTQKRALFVMSVVSGVMVAAIVSSLFWKDRQREALRGMSVDKLARHIFLPHPNGEDLIKIRVPQEKGLFATIINMAFLDATLNTEYSIYEYLRGATAGIPDQLNPTNLSRMMVSWMPHIVAPAFQINVNKRFYPELRDLEPDYMKYLPKNQRIFESTSSVARWLGPAIGLSPIQFDFLIEGYIGRSSRYFIGKEITNPFIERMYLTSSRQLIGFYAERQKNSEEYQQLDKRTRPFTQQEALKIRSNHTRIKNIEDLMDKYRDAYKNDKNSENTKLLRTRILDEVDAL